MNISIIIPNYNGENILPKNLPKVLAAVKDYKKGFVEIIIADDPSTDRSGEIIADFIGSIKEKHIIGKTISNKDVKERGFSKNVNRGVSMATGEILLLLNSDVAPHKDFLSPLIRHFDDLTVFSVACMDESIEDGKVVLRGRALGRWMRGFLMHRAGSVETKTNTMWVSGGSGAFRKSMWDELGGLNELFNPFYWEDIDLCYRAQKCGYTILFEKKSIVVHEHEEGTINKNFSPYNKIKVVYRNQFTFIWINITDFSLLISHVFWLPYHLLKAVVNGDKALLWGFFSAFWRLPKILQYKSKMKKLFVKSDKETMKAFAY